MAPWPRAHMMEKEGETERNGDGMVAENRGGIRARWSSFHRWRRPLVFDEMCWMVLGRPIVLVEIKGTTKRNQNIPYKNLLLRQTNISKILLTNIVILG